MSGLDVTIDGDGPDLVLLHGWGFHSGTWEGIVPRLARRHRVHRIDLPGHGRSGSCGVDAFDDAAEQVAQSIPDGSVVVGWSLGGLIAQRIAARGSARVAGLALVSSTPCFLERDDWACAMRAVTLDAFARDLERDTPGTLERFVRLNALKGAGARETLRSMPEWLSARPGATADGLRRGMEWLREVDLRDGAARIGVPCVVVHGSRDAIAPVGAGRWLAARIPGARLVEIEDAAHLPFASHAEPFLQALEGLA